MGYEILNGGNVVIQSWETVEEVISDLNVMIGEAPISTEAASGLAEVVGILEKGEHNGI